jgi:hypothetical protein
VASSAAPADGTAHGSTSAAADWNKTAYRGGVDVVEGSGADRETVTGTVFVDRNRNSAQDRNERGLAGVSVSNGRVVTTTDSKGRYELPVEDNMTVFVTQPRGYQVPVDDDNVAQFHYHHLPTGSPELRYGGLEPTGPVPDELNFPLTASTETRSPEQHCAIGADVQTYNAKEAEYARAGAFADLAERSDYTGCGVLFLGDVVGDDLSMFDETRDLTRTLNGPARFLPGNHDLDFDSPARDHNFDTFRAQLGPEHHRVPRHHEPVHLRPRRASAGVAAQRHRSRARGPRHRAGRAQPAAGVLVQRLAPHQAAAGDLRHPRGP